MMGFLSGASPSPGCGFADFAPFLVARPNTGPRVYDRNLLRSGRDTYHLIGAGIFLHSYVLAMTMPRFILALAAAVSLCTGPALAQDAPSLGDIARQARQQKQQQANSNSDTSSAGPQNTADDPQTAKPSKVITNDEIPEHPSRVPSNAQKRPSSSTTVAGKEVKRPPEYWKAQVQQLKNSMATLQRRIDVLNGSLHAALTNSNDQPVWNLREKEKERQLAELQAQMSDLQRLLEDTQESARRQGYGSSVYDP
jgi:hypothetical protein